MSKWSEISNPIDAHVETADAMVTERAAAASKEVSFTSMTPVNFDTTDGRRIEAYVHQGSRTVYPKLEG